MEIEFADPGRLLEDTALVHEAEDGVSPVQQSSLCSPAIGRLLKSSAVAERLQSGDSPVQDRRKLGREFVRKAVVLAAKVVFLERQDHQARCESGSVGPEFRQIITGEDEPGIEAAVPEILIFTVCLDVVFTTHRIDAVCRGGQIRPAVGRHV